MKKFIVLAALICGFLVSNSQSYTYIAQRYRWLAGLFEALGLPAGDSAQFKPGQRQQAGAVYYDSVGADAGFYTFTGTAWVLVGSPAAAELPNELISGGKVTYSGTGLKFYISPAIYRITGVIYGTDYDSVTLTAADPTDPRKDVIYVASTGVEVLTGTPAGPAAEPQLDANQIKLTVVDVPTGSTVPTITTNVIYDDNLGESVVTNVGTTTDPDNTTNVYRGTKSLNVTNIIQYNQIIFTPVSSIDLTIYEGISMFLRLKAIMASNSQLWIQFYNGSTAASNEIPISFNHTSLTYQGLTIPMTAFNLLGAFADKVRIRYHQFTGVTHPGFYLDYVHFESGVPQPGGGDQLVMGSFGTQTSSPDGAVIAAGKLHMQPVTTAHYGLMSPAQKAKLDSLRSDYFIDNVGDGEELATQVNDSTVGIKSFSLIGGVLISTDSTFGVDLSGVGSSQTLQQIFDEEVGGSVLSKSDSILMAGNSLTFFNGKVGIGGVPNSLFRVGIGVSSFLTVDPDNNRYEFGDLNGILNSTYMSIDDANSNIEFNAGNEVRIGGALKWFFNSAGELGEAGAGDLGAYNFQASLGTSRFKDMVLEYETAPGTPSAGLGHLYTKSSDKKLYWKDDTGTEYDLTGGGGSYTDADARAAISLTTTGSSGAATYNSGTGVFNIPDYSSGTSIWNGTVIGTSFSATSTTISSSALQWTFTGSSPATFTLPARTSSVNQFYTIKNIGSADLTVAADGTDDIYTTSSVASVTVVPGGSIMITGAANGTSDLWTALFHTSGSGTPTVASEGLTMSADTVQLGQEVGAGGDPAMLTENREIPVSTSSTYFKFRQGTNETKILPAGAFLTYNPLGGGLQMVVNPTTATRAFPGVSFWRGTSASTSGSTLLAEITLDLNQSGGAFHHLGLNMTNEIDAFKIESAGSVMAQFATTGDAYFGGFGTKKTRFGSFSAPVRHVDITGSFQVSDSALFPNRLNVSDSTAFDFGIIDRSTGLMKVMRFDQVAALIGGTGGTAVDTLYRTPGVDSIKGTRGGVYFSIKDSASSGTAVSLSKGWFADTITIAGVQTITNKHDLFDDCLTTPNSTAGTSYRLEVPSGTGADASIGNTGTTPPNGNGWAGIVTGTTTTGSAALATTSVSLGKNIIDTTKTYRWEERLQIETLSDDTEDFRIVLGLVSSTTNTTATNQIWFRYNDNTNSGNWTCYSADGTTTESTNSGVAAAAGTAVVLAFEYDNAAINFYINGSLVATHTTRVPAHNSASLFPVIAITKTLGSTSRTVFDDYVKYRRL